MQVKDTSDVTKGGIFTPREWKTDGFTKTLLATKLQFVQCKKLVENV